MEKKSRKDFEALVLEKKIVEVKPIIRRKPYLKKGHDGEHTYTGCSKGISLFYDVNKRSFRSPFTQDGEQEAFEFLLNQKEGALNLYNFKVTEPNFWGDFSVKIPKEGLILDLMNPTDALRYRILRIDPKVATTSQQLGVAERLFKMISKEDEKEQLTKLASKKDQANDYMHTIKKSKQSMINVLRLLGKKVDASASADWLKSELYTIIDEVSVTKGVAGLDKFLAVKNDPIAEDKLFVLDAIEAQEITRFSGGFKIQADNTFLGRTYEEAVRYFLGKDPKVKEAKLIIQERIK